MLTRLNGNAMAVNSDLIKLIEAAPDTVITLTTGEKLVVREGTQEVIAKVIGFRRQICPFDESVTLGQKYPVACIADSAQCSGDH